MDINQMDEIKNLKEDLVIFYEFQSALILM